MSDIGYNEVEKLPEDDRALIERAARAVIAIELGANIRIHPSCVNEIEINLLGSLDKLKELGLEKVEMILDIVHFRTKRPRVTWGLDEAITQLMGIYSGRKGDFDRGR